MHKTTSLDTWVRTPSGHQYKWDRYPCWVKRTQGSDHPTLKLGCTRNHARSPAGLLLHRTLPPLQPPGFRPMPTSLPADVLVNQTSHPLLDLLTPISYAPLLCV